MTTRLYRVTDGLHAMEFLYKVAEFQDAPTPHLILLNLNMPRMDGYEGLSEVQKDKWLRQIPIVVLTSSPLNADRAKCLAMGARVMPRKRRWRLCWHVRYLTHGRSIRGEIGGRSINRP